MLFEIIDGTTVNDAIYNRQTAAIALTTSCLVLTRPDEEVANHKLGWLETTQSDSMSNRLPAHNVAAEEDAPAGVEQHRVGDQQLHVVEGACLVASTGMALLLLMLVVTGALVAQIGANHALEHGDPLVRQVLDAEAVPCSLNERRRAVRLDQWRLALRV